MTFRFVPLRRIAALSAAIALFASPLAAAQAPAPVSPGDQPANTGLLSPAAFARLVQGPRAGVVPAPVAKDRPPVDLLRQTTAAMARPAAALSPQPPRSSGGWGKKTVGVLFVVGVVVGLLAVSYYTGADFQDLFNAFGDWAGK